MEKNNKSQQGSKVLKKVQNLEEKIHVMSADNKKMSSNVSFLGLKVESLENSIKVVSSKVDDLDGKFDKIWALQQEMSAKLDAIGDHAEYSKDKHDEHNQRLNEHDEELTQHDVRLKTLGA